MKIKVALLDKDKVYLERISSVFSTKYADKLEVYSFTDEATAIKAIPEYRIDVLVADEEFDVDRSSFKRGCGLAYFTGTIGVELIKDEVAICKFQKVDLIFKQILGIYSDMTAGIATFNGEADESRIIMFTSPCGGVGTSTMAAACAVTRARLGKRVFYLNLEQFGATDVFFQGEGNTTMSDVIYSLKSKKTNLILKLESCIKQSTDGVFFFSSTKVALDILELTYSDIEKLIANIQGMGSYDEIIIDLPFSLHVETLQLLSKAHEIIMINDGKQLSNTKFVRAYESLILLEQNDAINILGKVNLMFNQFSNKDSHMLPDEFNLNVLGGAPRYEHASVSQIVEALSNMELFKTIMQ